jgi:hypothetical protein
MMLSAHLPIDLISRDAQFARLDNSSYIKKENLIHTKFIPAHILPVTSPIPASFLPREVGKRLERDCYEFGLGLDSFIEIESWIPAFARMTVLIVSQSIFIILYVSLLILLFSSNF